MKKQSTKQAIEKAEKTKNMLVLKTNTREYLVKKNDDGTIDLRYLDGHARCADAGRVINSLGGVAAVLAKCVEVDEAYVSPRTSPEYPMVDEVKDNDLSKSNLYNLLAYLYNTIEVDVQLPTLGVSYTFSKRIDRNGKPYVSIHFLERVEIDGVTAKGVALPNVDQLNGYIIIRAHRI